MLPGNASIDPRRLWYSASSGGVPNCAAKGNSLPSAEHRAEFRLADAGGVLKHCLKHGLQLARRGTNDPKHFRGRGLLLQRFREIVGALAQLVEQPRVLDGDDRLRGEVLQ